MKQHFRVKLNVLLIISMLSLAVSSCRSTDMNDRLCSSADQLLLVIADNDSTNYARMMGYERSGAAWNEVLAFPVVLGRNGLGWGIGLHSVQDHDADEPLKREGDGKSPMGVFELPCAWGYEPEESVDTLLPYTQATDDLICIDDVKFEYYNMVIDRKEKEVPADSGISHETMVRKDVLYKYTVFVAHNAENPVAGSGSCIFLHLWSGEDSHTAGCTAMSESNMLTLLSWIDPDKKPLLVQLTNSVYERLHDIWDLPNLER